MRSSMSAAGEWEEDVDEVDGLRVWEIVGEGECWVCWRKGERVGRLV